MSNINITICGNTVSASGESKKARAPPTCSACSQVGHKKNSSECSKKDSSSVQAPPSPLPVVSSSPCQDPIAIAPTETEPVIWYRGVFAGVHKLPERVKGHPDHLVDFHAYMGALRSTYTYEGNNIYKRK